MVYMSRREKCSCGSPVFEMTSCNGCGTSLLLADETIAKESGDTVLSLTKPESSVDDFSLDIESDDIDSYEDADADDGDVHSRLCILAEQPSDETGSYWLNNDRVLKSATFKHAYLVNKVEGYEKSNGNGLGLRCPCCQHTTIQNFEFYRHFPQRCAIHVVDGDPYLVRVLPRWQKRAPKRSVERPSDDYFYR